MADVTSGTRQSLGESTWRELWQRRSRPLLAIPVGSCEQHGPHLPLDTDTRIAVALAEGLVDAFDPGDIMVGPSLTITAQAERAMSLWPNKGEADARPEPGGAYVRVEAVRPLRPAVPDVAPAALAW